MQWWARKLVMMGLCFVGGCDEEAEAETEDEPLVIPDNEYCRDVRSWPDVLVEREDAILERINAHRSDGAQCGDIARFPPSEPLRAASRATCAARVHAADMAAADFVDHIGTDESSPWDRLRAAGSSFSVADEVLAAGDLTPETIVDELWMTRPGSCAALMAPEYLHLGVGWATGDEESTHVDYVVVMPERSRAILHDSP